jgi:uncharacterized phage protein (TIGR01671 family)
MEEIKLRAWHEAEKKMYIGVGIDSNQTFPRAIEGGGIDSLKLVLVKDVVLELFTGRLDKHGEEICKGDIINVKINSLRLDRGNDYEVIWSGAGFSLIDAARNGDKYGVFTRRFPLDSDIFEIIGNIHQV